MKRCKTGSSLLLTLMVVSLLMILTLAFSVFVRMSLRDVILSQHQRQAQSISKLSVNLAIARLQEMTGPDQRSTAAANLFQGDSHNVYQPDLRAAVGQSHWTGVWDSTGFLPSDMTNKPFLGWLVSGTSDSLQAVRTASGSEFVTLVAGGSVSSAEQQVHVPSVEMDQGGRYAWWAGDEGLKARMDLLDPWRGQPTLLLRQQSWTVGQRHGVERFLPDPTGFPFEDEAFAALLSRWMNLEHVPLSMASISPDREQEYSHWVHDHFHEVTLYSASVLANVKDGGLKRDLSQAFEMPRERFLASVYAGGSPDSRTPYYQPTGYPQDEAVTPLFSVRDFSSYGFEPERSPMWISEANPRTATQTLAPEFRGPSWHLFRNFYRLYKHSDSDRSPYGLPTTAGVQAADSQSPHIMGRSFFPDISALGDSRRYGQDPFTWSFVEDFKSGNQRDTYTVSRPISQPVHPGISPILTRLQLVVSIRMRDAGDGIHMIPDLYLDPLVTLWNPYNVALHTGEQNGQPLQISLKNFDLRLELDSDGDDGVEHQQDFTTLLSQGVSGDGSYLRNGDEAFLLNLDIPRGLALEPGEFIILSPRQGTVTYHRQETSPEVSGVVMDLVPGISYLPEDSGFHFEDAFNVQLTRLLPDNVTPRRIRFRSRSVADNSKIRLIGVNRTSLPGGPFFSSLQGAMSDLVDLQWSSSSYQVDSSTLSMEKHPFVIYEIHTKVAESSDPIPLIQQFNPRAHVQEQGTYIRMDQTAYQNKEDLWFAFAERLSDWNGSWLDTHGTYGAYGGSSLQSNRGRSHVSLFEVPTRPFLSLGSLQHVPVGHFCDEPAFPIGNSIPSVFHRREDILTQQNLNPDNNLARWSAMGRTRTPTREEWTVTRPDWSYWLNTHLWDGYYFSGMLGAPLSFYQGSDPAGVSMIRPWLDAHQTPQASNYYLFYWL